LRRLKFVLDRSTLTKLYVSFIRPILEYNDFVWCNMHSTYYIATALENINTEAARIVSGAT